MFAPDGFTMSPKLDCLVEPTLYLLFNSLVNIGTGSNGLIRIFIKQGVENFIFNGADLMWPGIAYVEA